MGQPTDPAHRCLGVWAAAPGPRRAPAPPPSSAAPPALPVEPAVAFMAELAVGASFVLPSTQSFCAGNGGHVDTFSLILIYSAENLVDFTSEGAFHLPPFLCPQVTACSVSRHASRLGDYIAPS